MLWLHLVLCPIVPWLFSARAPRVRSMNTAPGSSIHPLVLLADVAWLATVVWGVIDVVRTQGMRTSDKVAWAVSVVAIPVVGVLAWIVFRVFRGRSMRES